MDETEVNSAQEEFATHNVESQAPSEQQQSQESEKRREADQDRNWRAARERIAALEAESKRKDELIEKAINGFTQKHQAPEPEEPEEPDDEYINKAGVKKVAKKFLDPLEKKVQELEAKLEQNRQKELYQNLRSKYSDFDDVVNAETIALLEEKEPDLANTIAEIRDPVKMGLQTYKYIKALNLSQEAPDKRHQKESMQKLEKNEKTLQSPQAYDKRPMAQAFKLTEDMKNELYKEMTGYASMASSVPPMF